MDNLIKFRLGVDVCVIFKIAHDLTKDLDVKFVNETALFSALILNSNNEFHKKLIAKGMSNFELNETVLRLISNNQQTFLETSKCKVVTFMFKSSKGATTKLDVLVSAMIWNSIERYVQENYEMLSGEPTVINAIDLLKIIINYFPDLYSNYMDIYFAALKKVEGVSNSKKPIVQETIGMVLPYELHTFVSVMNDKYLPDEEKCPILGRERETEQLIKILAKAKKRNAILIGKPGVGKTALVEKLTWQIVTGNCPEKFRNSKILSLDVTSIIAGTKFRGTAEERFQNLINFLEENKDCILFIDEIHTILGAGACSDGELDLANALKPILARGDTQVIGATTLEEYEKYFSKDGALKRRFEKISVKEPRANEVYPMIKNQIDKLTEFHNGVTISRKLIDYAILNASCFNYETSNPDRTLDLIDRSMAGAELNSHTKVTKNDIMDNFDIRMEQFNNAKDSQKRATAYHEAGHFILRWFSSELNDRKTLAISIMPADGYVGVNVLDEDDTVIASDNYDYFIQTIATLLGGRVAEKMYTSKLSAGARSDLEKANKIAERMVTEFGLVDGSLPERVYSLEKGYFNTDRISTEIDEQVKTILRKAKKYAENLLDKHRKELEIIVEALMQKGIINQKEIEELLKNYPKEA